MLHVVSWNCRCFRMWVEWLLTFVLFLVAIWNCMLESLFEWLSTCGMFAVAS
jgi:hypothetical protein